MTYVFCQSVIALSLEKSRGVNLVGNLGLGGRWQIAFGSKLLTRKTGRVETSDTVEDKNKNVI